MPIISKYERIKMEQGEEAAKQYMRDIRKKVNPKNIKGRPKKKIGSEAEG